MTPMKELPWRLRFVGIEESKSSDAYLTDGRDKPEAKTVAALCLPPIVGTETNPYTAPW